MSTLRSLRTLPVVAAAAALLCAAPAAAIQPPSSSALASKAFARPELTVRSEFVPIDRVPAALAPRLQLEIASLTAANGGGFYDLRGGRWGSLVLSSPLVPGPGAGNSLSWTALGGAPSNDAAYKQAVWNALGQYLQTFQSALRIAPTELGAPRMTVYEKRSITQVYAPRMVNGVPVRGSFLVAGVNRGNLVLLGTRNWGDVAVSTAPTVSAAAATSTVENHLRPATVVAYREHAHLELVPVDRPGAYGYRLAWVLQPTVAGDAGSWEALIDAQSGELLSFTDRNQYAERTVGGGIYPVSNDGVGADGTEQAGYPMPFADLAVDGVAAGFTNAHGLANLNGRFETTLSGPYVKIADTCGPIREVTSCADLDLGTGPGTNCEVPAGHSPGDTHSARTGFYEVNRLNAAVRSYLPDNAWLQSQVTANMNINNHCNAFWNGTSINFYQEGTNIGDAADPTDDLDCGNTGEIAAVFDHEWGHGLDDNDNNGEVSMPGEAYADINAIYRLNDSCAARGFFLSGTCGGNGDPCLTCSGVREMDWAKRQSGRPHDIDWILGLNADVPGGCGVGTQTGPCGLETHCEGVIVGEAYWDLYARDLQGYEGSPTQLDAATALETATRLYLFGASNVVNWYQCSPGGSGLGGCSADGGYLNALLVDDDNGSLVDGTPHMGAIFAAFDRHQIACLLPTVTTAGCAAAPGQQPVLTASAGVRSAHLSWSAVPGATEYWVYRTEGVHGFDFGKQRIAVTGSTSLDESGLLDGFNYYYGVLAVNAGCLGPMSAPAAVVAQAPTVLQGAALEIVAGSARYAPQSGDGDEFLDNCEQGDLVFRVESIGDVPLTNVRIVSARSTTHPQVVVTTPLPKGVASSLSAQCGTASAGADARLGIAASGVSPGDTVEFDVSVGADQLPAAGVLAHLRITKAESDWVAVASRKYGFDGGLDGWQAVQGSFLNVPVGGAAGGYVATTAAQEDECNELRSPTVKLTASSTLELYNRYVTEPYGETDAAWFDRANFGVVDLGSGLRTTIVPDGGRPYSSSGPNGTCVTNGEPGWSTDVRGDTGAQWAASTFSATALQGLAGRRVALDLGYGTDQLFSGAGFWLDEVTLTNFEEEGADQRSDVCPLVCNQIDDAGAAVEYSGGWHRVTDAAASSGGYHRRMGEKKGGDAPVARVVFTGPEITYSFVRSNQGGTADIYLDGVKRETLSYAGPGAATFGHSVTYGGLSSGSHELRIAHRSGAVYVDGFRLNCANGGASTAAVRSRSETTTSTGTGSEGPVISRTVTIGPADKEVSVVVEGSSVPMTVKLLGPSGSLVATGGALISGLTASGLDAVTAAPGTYTVQVINTLPPLGQVKISVARTVRVP